MSTKPAAWRYTGPGYFPGIPPRDLTQTEFDALSINDQLNIAAGTLYREVKPKAAPPTDAPKGDDKKGGK